MVDIADILLKAAEDVQQGMWCKGHYYDDARVDPYDFLEENEFCNGQEHFEHALASKRCALGSLAIVTKLLGGDIRDWTAANYAVVDELRRRGKEHRGIASFNDSLPDDPFEAGQQLAELFRSTAEAL